MDGRKRRRSRRGRRAVVVLGRSARRRLSVRGLFGRGTAKLIGDSLMIGGGAVGSVWAINQIPGVSKMNNWTKAGIQALIGVLGVAFIPGAMAKKLLGGFIVGGAITAILPFVRGVKFAGEMGRPLSADEIRELTGVAGSGSMGVPVLDDSQLGVAYRGPRNYVKTI